MLWNRLWYDIKDDPKMWALSDKHFRHYIYLMAVVTKHGNRGLLRWPLAQIAKDMRITPAALRSLLAGLDEAAKADDPTRPIVEYSDNHVQFLNWAKRNPESDDSGKRKKEWRDKSRDKEQGSPVPAHGTKAEPAHGIVPCPDLDLEVDSALNLTTKNQAIEHTENPQPPVKISGGWGPDPTVCEANLLIKSGVCQINATTGCRFAFTKACPRKKILSRLQAEGPQADKEKTQQPAGAAAGE